MLLFMTDVTQILSQIEQGDPTAAEQLLPLVYDELRKLAAAQLAHEKPGQTLQATALVHEAYLRLVDVEKAQQWNSRGHFFAAAAEAMRRILVDCARDKRRLKRGGGRQRLDLDEIQSPLILPPMNYWLSMKPSNNWPSQTPSAPISSSCGSSQACPQGEAEAVLGYLVGTADRHWAYARAWLFSG